MVGRPADMRQLPVPVAPDDGSAPTALVGVLAEHAAGRTGMREVVTALAAERLLVPLLEVSGAELESSDTDPCGDQDRAVAAVSVHTEDGLVGLGFTSVQTLAQWDPRARPWPTPAPRVAGALLLDGGVRLVIDAGGEHSVTLVGTALRRLANGAEWPDPWVDPAVRDAVVSELAPVLASGEVAVRLAPGDTADVSGSELSVELAFPAGTSSEVAAQRAGIVADRLSGNADLRAVFDGTLLVRASVRTRDSS